MAIEEAPNPIEEIKESVETYRERIQHDWENVRSAVDPRDNIEDVIRKRPFASVGTAAFAGIIAGSAFLPAGKRSPIGIAVGGVLGMAYRGFFMAATPLFAQKVASVVAPQSMRPVTATPPHLGFPQELSDVSPSPDSMVHGEIGSARLSLPING